MQQADSRHGPGNSVSDRMFRSRGFTLIEAVIAIVVLAAAAAGVLAVFTTGPFAASADPLITAQARAVASSYMDEIVRKNYRTQDDGVTDCGVDEGDRSNYDTIWCYDDLDEQPPRNQSGDEISELAAYSVTVTVDDDEDFGATIAVQVGHDSGRVDYELRSNRGDY